MAVKGKGPSPTASVVFTANRLRDGQVVWLGAGEQWEDVVSHARVFIGDTVAEGLALAKAAEQRQFVVGAYQVEVEAGTDGPQALSVREKIRIHGPSAGSDVKRPPIERHA